MGYYHCDAQHSRKVVESLAMDLVAVQTERDSMREANEALTERLEIV